MFKSTRGDAEDALPDAGVSGSANDEGVPGRSIDAGVIGRTNDAGVSESGLSLEDELDEGADERDEADADDDADRNNGGVHPLQVQKVPLEVQVEAVVAAVSSPVSGF